MMRNLRANQAICITAVAAAALLAWPATGRAQVTGYETLDNWSSLPSLNPGVAGSVGGLASSYDRTGGNNDYNNYNGVSPTDGLPQVLSLTGPGVLDRFWMPHLSANGGRTVRVYVDGTKVIDTDSNTLLPTQSYGPGPQFRSPLVASSIGGSVSYEPIPFKNSVEVTTDNAGTNFYQWNYHLLPAGTNVLSYGSALTPAQQSTRDAARAAAVTVMANPGQNPAGAAPGGTVNANLGTQSVAPGASVTLASLSGSGQIRSLNLNLPAGVKTSDAQLDSLRLRVRYDNNPGYAVDVPVSQFFGVGHGRADYKSLPLGVATDGSYYSYWPMPYRSGAKVELFNAGTATVNTTSSNVESTPGAVPADAGYLHADFKSTPPGGTTSGQQTYQLLRVGGSGRYVGNILSVTGAGPNVPLEGDDLITTGVDGPAAGQNTLHGTGLEDAYNGGYYYNHLDPPFQVSDHGDTPNPSSGGTPLSGLLAFGSFYNTQQYRWLIPDAVPFANGIDVSIENYGGDAGNMWSSTAFYYSTAAPEPGAVGLLIAAGAGLVLRRRRRGTSSDCA